ncbi:hypothetical protein Val02_07140 [Virgisporangium aliadipatigenens]|uniref:FAD-binding domain-containing protein n=1 Tax=Virgisporangium aliadipatigenens TaxID=741659 RepID=A0A8J4DNQ4_9ACTN|nr:FAD-dependent monooxygenase [Virgisporangium aliadipatigenens]GIJ43828.1 hypothetical protein Val02_07140 [Virgisporangium aliadipatigenens]
MGPDVVVCGAGAAGLAAAHALGLLGLRVLVLERRTAPSGVAKGELLQPESIGALDGWGVLPALYDAGVGALARIRVRDPLGAPLLTLDYDTLGGAYRRIGCVPYPTLLRAFAERLAPTVELRRNVRVVEPLRNGGGRVNGVRVADGETIHDIPARLVVAADGVSSRLRTALLMPARRRRYDHSLLTLELRGAGVAEEVSAHRTPRGLRLLYPLPDGRVRLYAQVGRDEFRGGTGDLNAWADRLLADTPALAPLAGPLREGLHRRQLFAVYRVDARALAAPGFVLVGEAAHAVHPVAAQGVSAALADAWALAAHLAAAGGIEAAAVDRALRGYAHERMTRHARTATLGHDLARMLTGTGGLPRLLGTRTLRRAATNPGAILGELAGVAMSTPHLTGI